MKDIVMKSSIKIAVIGGILLTVAFLAGSVIFLDKCQKEAIQHGFAQHNPITGYFEWKEGRKQ